MKKQRVTTKLSITYVFLIVIFILIAIAFFYTYTRRNLYEEGRNNISQLAESTMVQIDNRMNNIEDTAVDVLGNNDFLPLWEKCIEKENKPKGEYSNMVRRILTKAYMNRTDIRRVTVFNSDGYYISTGNYNASNEVVALHYQKIEANEAMVLSSSRMFMGPHDDFWDENSTGTVVSQIAPIKNTDKQTVGYMEIQQNVLYAQRICDLSYNSTRLDTIVFLGYDDNLFYANTGKENTDYIERIRKSTANYARIRETKDEILFTSTSNFYYGRVVCVLKKSVLYHSLYTTMKGIMIAGILIALFSIVFSMILTHNIMKPINLLIKYMNQTNILNFKQQPEDSIKDRESEILIKSFNEMTTRMQDSINKQRQMEEVQTKTLFGILQSEISPHFLFNTLGSIANMCESNEAASAADACYDLTDILRYSSNFKTGEVTISEEVEKLKSYLSIMKSRYRQRLVYEIETDKNVENVLLPKLTYQPIVENAIKYSLTEQEQVKLSVKTYIRNGLVVIKISDNGNGIPEQSISEIRKSVDNFIEESDISDLLENIKIGGMGLSGTLTRLSIFYGDAFDYHLTNHISMPGMTVELTIDLERI